MNSRDLKLDNTLLDDSNPPLLKLCDFGFAKTWDAEDANMYTHIGWVTDLVQLPPQCSCLLIACSAAAQSLPSGLYVLGSQTPSALAPT